MQVVDMMRKTVLTATADMSLAQAQHRMQEHRIRHLPVVAQTHLIGLLTDRDLRDALPSAVTTLGPAEIAQHLDTIAVETCMTTRSMTGRARASRTATPGSSSNDRREIGAPAGMP